MLLCIGDPFGGSLQRLALLGNPQVLFVAMFQTPLAFGEERQLLVDGVGTEGVALLLYLSYGFLFGRDGILGLLVGSGGLC